MATGIPADSGAATLPPPDRPAHDDRPLLEQMRPDERDRFVRAVAAFLLSSVQDDIEREARRGARGD